MLIRAIRTADWPVILQLQQEAYHALAPESEAVLQSKTKLGPDTCLVACLDDEVVGYCLAHPWLADEPASLYRIYPQPAGHQGLYLHDMVVSPRAQGRGIARRFMAHLQHKAHQAGMATVALVAVQGADRYWRRYQFVPRACDKDLSAYGPNAVYMQHRTA